MVIRMEVLLKQCISFAKMNNDRVELKDKLTMEQQLKRDMVGFSLWLANADKKIDKAELVTIARTLDIDLDDSFKVLMEDVKKNHDT